MASDKSKNKILLADDDPDIVKTIKMLIEAEGFEVIVAYDGEEAIQSVIKDDPDVVILDIRMPKKDGYEVIKEIRKIPKWRPVIMVSALGELQDIKKGYEHEADFYITKPFDTDKLLRGIKTMLSLIPQRRRETEEGEKK